MSTYYIDNASSGNQYYFNANSATTSQSSRTHNTSGYSTYPSTNLSGSYSPNQQIRIDSTYQLPQQYQSVAGFNRNVTQPYYQVPQSPAPQVRASIRVVGNQEQYQLPSSSQPIHSSPQQHHFQFDSRQQPGHPTGPPTVYQTPGAAQFTHRNVDLWTEGPSQGQDHYVQAQRVSVRSVSTGSPQQSHSVSPQRHQDHLQQYYSQLTPEQHQQLLRQQQLQRQQEQNSYSTQHRSTAGFNGGQQYQQVSPIEQGRSRTESERQRQLAAQRASQQEEETSHPVGIRNLMSKFAPPASTHPRSRSTTSRNYSSSSYTTNSGGNKSTTRTLTSHSMTYSALPKPHEPPVNSVEYYQMQLQQQGGNPFTNIQQAAAPSHIQHSPVGLGTLRDRFKTGSLSDDFNRPQVVNRQPPPPQQQQQQQQQQTNAGGSNLSSLRNQYINRAKESSQDELVAQPVQNISRTIVGEDIPRQKPAPQPSQQQPPAPVLQAPPKEQPQAQPQPQNENSEQQEPSSEAASSPTTEDTTAATEGISSF